MKKLMVLAAIVAVPAIVAALALAASGGGDDGSDAAAAPSNGGETVAVEELGDAGSVLVDSTGQALYTSDQEASGRVLCTDEGCESFWAPLTIDRGQPEGSVPGELGVVERPDSTRQVTYDGTPLYTFTEEGPGEVTGDGFVDAFDGREFTWNVVAAAGSQGSDEPSDEGSGLPPGY